MIFNFRYLKGAVKIRITGRMPERFINLCLAERIFLWNITKRNDDLIAWISLDDFFAIRPLVRKSQTRVQVASSWGLPFLIKRIKQRKMMVVGGLIFILLLHVLSSYIWFIDITGLKYLSNDRIRESISKNGLKPGAMKEKIDIKQIERDILLNIPEVAWVGINFTGTRAVVEIVEKTLPKQENKAPAHIIAAKDGVITDIIVLAGQPAVKKGDTIKKGDLLIKGFPAQYMEPSLTGEKTAAIPQELIKAKGIVKARVWYEGYAEAELNKKVSRPTGNRQVAVMLKIGPNEIILKTVPNPPFAEYDTEIIHKQLPLWRNREFTVESTIKIYHEITSNLIDKSFEEARDEAQTAAMHMVQGSIPEAAQLLSRNVEVLNLAEQNIVRVKVSVETLEDITETMYLTQQ
ncbi:MAG TPA: sporulation protein YqfD [Methylomusa anaerophila]|uniref:Putative stage IV sporulation protein YqfD n=1 Tax=Methylomusa anaerophila TaxID=1930071 RepID=A0A348ANZ1_9FIRM|nr:sporulation protein YqfD [Methylomusa anaerophila]BBB92789.1 putative stage IV sporulation protein YqfD [Methylomusa anaerophila]HML87360.1 sporulation protein YqfD [Methylomusa anaerophila]